MLELGRGDCRLGNFNRGLPGLSGLVGLGNGAEAASVARAVVSNFARAGELDFGFETDGRTVYFFKRAARFWRSTAVEMASFGFKSVSSPANLRGAISS